MKSKAHNHHNRQNWQFLETPYGGYYGDGSQVRSGAASIDEQYGGLGGGDYIGGYGGQAPIGGPGTVGINAGINVGYGLGSVGFGTGVGVGFGGSGSIGGRQFGYGNLGYGGGFGGGMGGYGGRMDSMYLTGRW